MSFYKRGSMSSERQRLRESRRNQQTEIPLNPHWQAIFKKYDLDNDGKISLSELRTMILSETYENDIPEVTVQRIMQRADEDQNGYLDYAEFERLVHTKEFRSVMGHMLNKYVRSTVVPRYRATDVTDGRGDYEEEYSCRPPTLCMLIVSLIEIITFAYDAIADGDVNATGTLATVLLYNPRRRYEAWRYLTYMFVHVGVFHLLVNLLVQIMLGIPLEMVHRWWRVLILYLAGVVAGSLGTSISDPHVKLAGASGGVYALITAHVASIIMNWSEMRFAPLQLVVFIILAGSDIGTAIHSRYVLKVENQIGYAAHLAGAVAGLLLGINVLRNLEEKKWERVLWWASIIIYCLLMLGAIIANIAVPSYFPVQDNAYP